MQTILEPTNTNIKIVQIQTDQKSTKIKVDNKKSQNIPMVVAASGITGAPSQKRINVGYLLNKFKSVRELSDRELFQKCKQAGHYARSWSKKFAGLLPEVNRRRLFEKHGYSSIFNFAGILCGWNHDTIQRVLHLAQKLEDKPLLKALFETGEVGWTKLEIVAQVATPETDIYWSEKIQLLSSSGIEMLVREIRIKNGMIINAENLMFKKIQPDLFVKNTQNQGLENEAKMASYKEETLIDRNFGAEGNITQNRLFDTVSTIESSNNQNSFQSTSNDIDFSASAIQTQRYKSLHVLLDAFVEKRLMMFQREMTREKGKPVSLNEVIKMLLEGFEVPKGQKNIPKYYEVITHCSNCQKNVMRTRTGEVEITQEDLKERERIGEPINLEEQKFEATLIAEKQANTVSGEVPSAVSAISADAASCVSAASVEISSTVKPAAPRYMPSSVQKTLTYEYANICAFPGCTKLADIKHHTRRFLLFPDHNPEFIKPLCKGHEALCHAGLIPNEEENPKNWTVLYPEKSNVHQTKLDHQTTNNADGAKTEPKGNIATQTTLTRAKNALRQSKQKIDELIYKYRHRKH